MNNKEIITLLTTECFFFQKLPQRLKNKFVQCVMRIIKSGKISFSQGIEQDLAVKLKCAAVYAQLSFTRSGMSMTKCFQKIELIDNEHHISFKEKLNKFIIPVRYKSTDFWHTATYDIVYGIYHCYLKQKGTLENFADHVGKTEMLIIDQIDIKKTVFKCPQMNHQENSSLSMFGTVNEQFFNHPQSLLDKDKELYDSLVRLWELNPLFPESKIEKSPERIINKKIKPNGSQFHWVYQYTIISVFAGSFMLLNVLKSTIIYTWIILLLIIGFSALGLILIPVFKRYNFPVLKIPYLFFSVFGLGVNTTMLLLVLNLFTAKSRTVKEIIFPYKNEHIVNMRFSETGPHEYDVRLPLNKDLWKRVTFTSMKGTSPAFFVIKIKKGILGFYIIENKDVIHNTQ